MPPKTCGTWLTTVLNSSWQGRTGSRSCLLQLGAGIMPTRHGWSIHILFCGRGRDRKIVREGTRLHRSPLTPLFASTRRRPMTKRTISERSMNVIFEQYEQTLRLLTESTEKMALAKERLRLIMTDIRPPHTPDIPD